MEEMRKDVMAAKAELKQEGRDDQQEWPSASASSSRERRTTRPRGRRSSSRRPTSQGDAALKPTSKEFRQREAKIYYNIYQEIMQEVEYICQTQYGIAWS